MEQENGTADGEPQFLEEEVVANEEQEIHENVINEEEIEEEVVQVVEQDGAILEEVVQDEQVYQDQDGHIVEYVYQNEEIVEDEFLDLEEVAEGDVPQEGYSYVIEDDVVHRIVQRRPVQNIRHVNELQVNKPGGMKTMTVPMTVQSRFQMEREKPIQRRQRASAIAMAAEAAAAASKKTKRYRLLQPMQQEASASGLYASKEAKRRNRRVHDELISYDNAHFDEDDSVLADLEDSLPSYLRDKFINCLEKTSGQVARKQPPRPTLRELVEKGLQEGTSRDTIEEEVVFMNNAQFFDEQGEIIHVTEGMVEDKVSTLNDIARVDIEKQSPVKPNRGGRQSAVGSAGGSAVGGGAGGRSMMTYRNEEMQEKIMSDFTNQKRKLVHPLDQTQQVRNTSSMASINKPTAVGTVERDYMNIRLLKDPNVSAPMRFKCSECEEAVSTMEKLCEHLAQFHDSPTTIKQVDYFNEREFEIFMNKLERDGCSIEELEARADRAKTRLVPGTSQIFKCNFWSKSRQVPYPELVEIDSNEVSTEVEETCPAFVLKLNNYDSIRLKYCDYHLHAEESMGTRIPIPAKRRIYELSFKRLPHQVIALIIQDEANEYAPAGSRTEQKLKSITEAEVTELLANLHSSVKMYQPPPQTTHQHQQMHDDLRIEEVGETVVIDQQHQHEGNDQLVAEVKGEVMDERDKTNNEEGEEMASKNGEEDEGGEGEKIPDAPILEREEEVIVEEEEHIMFEDGGEEGGGRQEIYQRGLFSVDCMYDPQNDKDTLIEELTAPELTFLDHYETTNVVKLTEEQKQRRLKMKMKYMINTINDNYQSLDALTHGLSATDHRLETIDQARTLATEVLDIVCGLEAESRMEYSMTTSYEAIKHNLLASISSKEKRYNVSERVGFGRRKPLPVTVHEGGESGGQAGGEEPNFEEIYDRVRALDESGTSQSVVGINPSGSFSIPAAKQQQHRIEGGAYRDRPVLEEKGAAWYPTKTGRKRAAAAAASATDAGGGKQPPKRRGRPSAASKKLEEVRVHITTDDTVPMAISMGVDQEVEITTEGETSVTVGNEVNEAQAPPTTLIVEKKQPMRRQEVEEEAGDDQQQQPAAPPPEKEEEVTVTRTGRVVKQKKWQE